MATKKTTKKIIQVRIGKHRTNFEGTDYDRLIAVSTHFVRKPSDMLKYLIQKEYDKLPKK